MTDVLDEIRQRLAGRTHLWLADVEEAAAAATAHFKDATPEQSMDFVMSGLRVMRAEKGSWVVGAVNRTVTQLLRRKLPFTEGQVVEMLQLVSVPNNVFPFKGVLTAAQSVQLTPRLADALRELRPCITEYLGGGEMRDLHARIDILLNGPAPETALEVQGAWSQTVFQEIAASPQRSVGARFPACHGDQVE